MTIRVRITLLVTALIAAVAVAFGVSARISAEREMNEQIDLFLMARADETASLVDDFGQATVAALLPLIVDSVSASETLGSSGGLSRIVLADGTSAEFGAVGVLPPVGEMQLATDFESQRILPFEVDGVRYRAVAREFDEGGTLQVGRSLAEQQAALAGLTERMLFFGALIILAGGLLSWWLSGLISNSLERLSQSANRVAASPGVAVMEGEGGGREVEQLRNALNSMLTQLADAQHKERRLVRDAGHELRTPLTALRANSELLQFDDLDADDRLGLQRSLVSVVDQLSSVVDELTLLGDDVPTLHRSTCDLAEVVQHTVRRSSTLLRREISFRSPGPVIVNADPGLIDRAVMNLIDNAAKYSDTGQIRVVVATDDHRADVWVEDDGPGIDEVDLPLVFERFHRAASSRLTPGSGLGLSIVEHVATVHGGGVFARNGEERGAIVGFWLRDDNVAMADVDS